MKYSNKELQLMWANGEKSIYELRELAKKTKYKFWDEWIIKQYVK